MTQFHSTDVYLSELLFASLSDVHMKRDLSIYRIWEGLTLGVSRECSKPLSPLEVKTTDTAFVRDGKRPPSSTSLDSAIYCAFAESPVRGKQR